LCMKRILKALKFKRNTGSISNEVETEVVVEKEAVKIDVVKAHIPEGHPNRPGTKLSALKAIVIHYTQNDSPRATSSMNIRWIGRVWETGEYWSNAQKRKLLGPIERGSQGKGPNGLGIAFRYGSAHVFCDMDMVMEAIPLDEVAWGCGDRNYNGGYQRVAGKVFRNRQNFETISVEICNNDVIKNSDEDWEMAVEKAKQWVIALLSSHNLKVDKEGSLSPQMVEEAPPAGTVLLLRHYDITGKICPKPLVDDSKAWKKFVEEVYYSVES